MALYQFLDASGTPAITTDGKTALFSKTPIAGGQSFYFDDQQWHEPGEDGHDSAPLAAFLAKLPKGTTAQCMGRSPASEHPLVIADREAQAEQERIQEAEESAAGERAEQEAAAAKDLARQQLEAQIADELLQKRDPAAWAKRRELRAVNAKAEAELARATAVDASPDTVAGIEELREAAVAQVEAKFAPAETA